MMTIHVCVGSTCHLKGSYNIIHQIQRIIGERDWGEQITVKAAFCLGKCTDAVCIKVDDGPIVSVKEEEVEQFMEEWVARGVLR
jgi:NADH:ubiquinone oxidoreductase subunit E